MREGTVAVSGRLRGGGGERKGRWPLSFRTAKDNALLRRSCLTRPHYVTNQYSTPEVCMSFIYIELLCRIYRQRFARFYLSPAGGDYGDARGTAATVTFTIPIGCPPTFLFLFRVCYLRGPSGPARSFIFFTSFGASAHFAKFMSSTLQQVVLATQLNNYVTRMFADIQTFHRYLSISLFFPVCVLTALGYDYSKLYHMCVCFFSNAGPTSTLSVLTLSDEVFLRTVYDGQVFDLLTELADGIHLGQWTLRFWPLAVIYSNIAAEQAPYMGVHIICSGVHDTSPLAC